MITPEIKEIIEKLAKQYDISAALVSAFVMTESSGNPNAYRYEPAFYTKYIVPLNLPEEEGKGRAASYGLMQVMGEVARELGFAGSFEQLYDPETGLNYGIKHLEHYLRRYASSDNTLDYAIAAYNAGTPRKNKDGSFVNQGYVDMVKKYLAKFSQVDGA
jgi:soluble lytic murein transglycosylase-like protein